MGIVGLQLVVIFGMITVLAGASHYRGHKVLRVHLTSHDDVRHLHSISKRSNDQVKVWDDDVNEVTDVTLPSLDMMASPHGYHALVDALGRRGLEYDVITHDLQSDLDRHQRDNHIARMNNPDYFTSYHPLDEVLSFLENLVARCSGRCETFDIGQSFQGRPLRAIKITGPGGPTLKRKVWIDAGIHAREWISHATAQYIAERLVDDYDTDEFVKEIVDNYEWHILPCVNPDGYNYTWETDRLWRKTRRPNPGSFCVGTDANRNFDFKWGEVGVSSDPCTNNYMGPEPFSEPESRALADHLTSERGSWEVYLTLHSKGQLIMCPWGYTDTPPQDYPELARVGTAMQQAIYATHGQSYEFGSASSILYRSAGTSRDWARGAAGIKYVYTIELRDRGRYGWMLPPSQIRDTGEEIWAGLKAGLREIVGGA